MLFLDLFYCHGIANLWGEVTWQQDGRETLHADMIGPAKDGCPFDDIAEFSDVARPVIFAERLEGFFREANE
jgi:hypothetical protein